MEKLFYIDSYIKNFTAEIEEVKEVDDKFHVLLNKTAFFPGGGGQYCDLGTIDNINVLDVYEENDKIYHVLEKKPNRIHKVKCEIDWDRREYGMQHHFGQHIISACFNNEYKAKTVGFHLGKDFSTVDIEGFFKEEDILKIEKMCNEIIRENITVEFLNITKKEAKKLKIKEDLSKLGDNIRVVKIDDIDMNLCCGVHMKNTLDLRVIKIKKFEKYKKDLNETTIFVSINGTIGNIAFYNNEKIILGKSACYFNVAIEDLKKYFFYLFQTDFFLNYALDNAK